MCETTKPSAPLRGHRPGPLELLLLTACAALLVGFTQIDVVVGYPDPPDFANMPVPQKKQEFFAYLSPMISEVNFELASDQEHVRKLRDAYANGRHIGWFDRRWIDGLAIRLDVPVEEMDLGEALDVLERRADVVPESIVLAQAAIESGWGTSRFAREGNNYFGQRCYSPECGISPEGRPAGNFGLARFASVSASVESYIINLNTHPNYQKFRRMRLALQESGAPITGLALVDGLDGYSERGSDYVSEIRSMIRANRLE
jgi:Bax protein